MDNLYFIKEGQEFGPIKLSDAKPLDIRHDTLIWHEGLPRWTPAREIEGLQEYLKSQPPPPPGPKYPDDEYDYTYPRETDLIGAGILIFLLPFLLLLFGYNPSKSTDALILWVLVGLIVRISAVMKITYVAKRQNRDSIGWGIYAFFLPSISFINIGCLRRLKILGQPNFAELKHSSSKSNEMHDGLTDKMISNLSKSLLALFLIAMIIVLLIIMATPIID